MSALAMVTVCCSMTSWIATRSISLILSNSSMQTTPLSARTMAPASSLRSPVSESVVTAAVRPTPDEPLPLVEMARGAACSTKRRSCDFAVDGSPTMSTLMSPRRWVLVCFTSFSTPPRSIRRRPFLMYSWPKMDGARDRARVSKTSLSLESWRMLSMSVGVMVGWSISLPRDRSCVQTIAVRNTPLVTLAPRAGRVMYTPIA
mmetsp:Transcript_38238/g.89410  ORF Transcript_38238/g.89410 Transcript_38238/m.89410 type:complete len:203 (+) Transcript_38238:1039-1647(+)